MLTLRSQIKQDLKCSTHAIVLGFTALSSRRIFEFTKPQTHPSLQFVNDQQRFLLKFQYRKPRFPIERNTFVDLS